MSFIWNLIEKIAEAVFRFCFRVIRKEYTEKINASLMQFVKFGIVGVSNTVISYLLYAISLLIMKKLHILMEMEKYTKQD